MARSLGLRNGRIGPAQLPHPSAVSRQIPGATLHGTDQQGLLDLLGLQFHLQGLHSYLKLGLLGIEPDALEFFGDFIDLIGNTVGAFLCQRSVPINTSPPAV